MLPCATATVRTRVGGASMEAAGSSADGHDAGRVVQIVAAVSAVHAAFALRLGATRVHLSAVARAGERDELSASVTARFCVHHRRTVHDESAKRCVRRRRVSVPRQLHLVPQRQVLST